MNIKKSKEPHSRTASVFRGRWFTPLLPMKGYETLLVAILSLITILLLPARVHAEQGTIEFTDFSTPSGLTLNQDASTATSFDGISTALRLVPDQQGR